MAFLLEHVETLQIIQLLNIPLIFVTMLVINVAAVKSLLRKG